MTTDLPACWQCRQDERLALIFSDPDPDGKHTTMTAADKQRVQALDHDPRNIPCEDHPTEWTPLSGAYLAMLDELLQELEDRDRQDKETRRMIDLLT